MRTRKAMLAIILLVIPLLVTGVLTQFPTEVTSEVTTTPTRVAVPSYDEHTAFVIINDTDFHEVAQAELWEGSGTELDPYIIQGYNITTDSDCFKIDNVSLYFEIRDCYLNSITPSRGYGIIFQNVTNALIVDTFVMNKSQGISFSGSPYNTIQNCTILDCSSWGIQLVQSNNTLVDESEVDNCGSGIRLFQSNFTSIMRSDIHDGWGGITASSSRNCTFEANTIYDNSVGMSKDGIYLMDTDNSSIVSNEIFGNAQNGIYSGSCQDNYIFDNHIYNNSDHGIDIAFSENNTIKQNNIHQNGWWPVMLNELCGIHIGPAIDNVIEGNQIWNNTPYGIALDGPLYTTISENEIFNNTDVGIYGVSTSDVTVVDNEIYGNGWNPSSYNPGGIINEGGIYWWIEGNAIWNNTNYGILIESTEDLNTVIGNRVWDSSRTGIFISGSYSANVTENTVFSNEYGIHLMTIGTNVTSNIVYDNDIGIYAEGTEDCFIYDNDIGWNGNNAVQNYDGGNTFWYDNKSLGNWWHNYTGTGNYSIYNESTYLLEDIYPQMSMNVTASTPNAHEISSVGNEMVWNAFARNPLEFELYTNGSLYDSGTWNGGDLTLNVDGLSAGYHELELFVFHVSGHNFNASSSAVVTDLTAPSWIVEPSDQEIDEGEALSAQFSAEDESGIDVWAVNDTLNFQIDSTGLLTNATILAVGNYSLNVSVEDIFGNIQSSVIIIHVLYIPPATTTTTTDTTPTTDTTTQPPDDPGVMMTVVITGAGGALIIVIIVMKKKS